MLRQLHPAVEVTAGLAGEGVFAVRAELANRAFTCLPVPTPRDAAGWVIPVAPADVVRLVGTDRAGAELGS